MNRINGPRYPSWDHNKTYSRRVVFWCLLGFVLIVAAAGICAAVNLAGGAK